MLLKYRRDPSGFFIPFSFLCRLTMRRLTRYAIWEFVKVFLLALFAMTLFMLLVGIAREAVREGLGPGPILRLLPFIVPESMRFSIPASALLATCTSFGRMSGDNEVVAIKSMGISPIVLMVPVFIIGFLVSVLGVWVNDLSVSWGRQGMSRVVSESIEQIAYGMLRTQRAFSTDRFSITVKEVQGRRLILPAVSFQGADGGSGATVSAREAELRHVEGRDTLSILLKDGLVEGPGGVEGAFSGVHEYEIDMSSFGKGKKRSPSDYPLAMIPAESVQLTQQIRRLEYGLASQAAFEMFSGELGELGDHRWDEEQRQLLGARYRLNRLRTEPWRRWSNGFSCFFFVLIGAPWAIHRRNSDFVSIFFMCFIPILLLYYPLMAYGVDRAKAGAIPQYGVWMGNVGCALVAMWLIRKVLRN